MAQEDRRSEVMRLAIEHRAQIWGFIMGLAKDPNQAEDLFQSTHLILCEKWRQYEPGTNFLAWARQIARYEFLASVDHARHRLVAVEAEVLEAALSKVQSSSRATSANRLASKRRALQKCLEGLQDRSRQILELRYEQGLPCNTIARQLGMLPNALYKLLSRVRQGLATCVERAMTLEEA